MIAPEPPFYAQHGEDRFLRRLFARIGTTNKHAVEFGADDGFRKSNTAYFRTEHGWSSTLFDAEPRGEGVKQACITAENVNDLFGAHGIPLEMDLLSIDIDGNDLWVWQALIYKPRVLVIEYNPRWLPWKSRVVPYDPAFQWDRTDYYGASCLALIRLGARKGYEMVGSSRSNLIFTRKGWAPAKGPGSVKRAWHQKRRDPHKRPWLVYR